MSSVQTTSALDGTSQMVIAANQLAMRKYFGALLFCATVIPFFVALCNLLQVSQLNPVESLIQFMALIHVPMTAYLFFDPMIRNQMRNSPAKFVAMPVLIFAACLAVFLGNTREIIGQNVVLYFEIAVLAWNNWHFGKQNIGVFAYYRLSKSAGGMLPVEKKLIYLGAFLGAIVAAQIPYAPNVNLDRWHQISGYVGIFGKYFQYALACFALLHILRNPARFNVRSALMFFLCVNFFLPAYLGIGGGSWFAFYAASSYAHGVQYLVFLFFHSYNAKYSMPTSAKHLGPKFIASRYIVIFILLSLAIGDIYSWHIIIPPFHFVDKTSEAYWMSLLTALATGVLLTHFWFDSFFWKFTNKESRNWMIERYNFLFKSNRS